MYEEDLVLLRCPSTGQDLRILKVSKKADDGEILEGTLGTSSTTYEIRNGIPRFIQDVSYNASWDFKWRVLDGGRGLNYRILDKNDPAYQIHDIYDRNSHNGVAFESMKGQLVLDIGCGVGQYAIKTLQEHQPGKVVALDLTGGVDIFRKIVEERYPQFKKNLLIVQASVFALPFPGATFDYVYSLGVLMHTGSTLRALGHACRQVKPGGEINVWIYCSEPLAYDAVEESRGEALTLGNVSRFRARLKFPMFWIHLFRKIDHGLALRIIKFFSSETIYRLSKRRRFQWLKTIFPGVDHPDYDYRLINNYDGYVNNWCDTWSEHEIFPVLQENSIAILGVSTWRLGIWGKKIPGFYDGSGEGGRA
jgi:SAM-dependent methyltransferase